MTPPPPRRRRFALLALALLAGAATACRPRQPKAPDPLDAPARRLLFAQVVDDVGHAEEGGILEGQVYKYLLKRCADLEESELKKSEQKDPARAPTYERLLRQPDLFRGQVVVIRRAVVIEVAEADLPPEYGLPGYTVLPALLVDSARDLYELRLLCPPGSKMYERLRRGLAEGKNPVLRVSGYFLKDHAKRTAVAGEPPWRAPLLVGPEPSIERRAGTYDAYRELVDAKMDKYLPSHALTGPKAEERLVVELLPPLPRGAAAGASFRLRVYGQEADLGNREFLTQALARLKGGPPGEPAGPPSAVVLRTCGAPLEGVPAALKALADLGIQRLFAKDENEVLLPEPEAQPKRSGEDGAPKHE